MDPNPLSPTALIRVFDRLRPLLGKADAQRLDQLHPLMARDGRINQAQLLSTLFPDKSPRDSLTALRQFRERINAAAKDGDMLLEFHQDGQTKAPATQRSVFFTGDDLAARGAEALTDESTSDIPARIASGELRQDQQAMPADAMEVATVISYGHDDKSLMLDLLGRLKRLFAQSNRYRFKIWFDERLLLGKPFDPPIRDRFRHCHLGLLMLSPDFAKSDYIRDLEFPHFVLGDALGGGERHPVPISLRPVQLSDHPHLKRLKPSLVFYGERKCSYEECKGARARDAFAAALFAEIEKLLEHHPPPVAGPPPRDTLVERDLADRLAEQWVPQVAAARGRPGGMAEAPRENAGTQDALDFLQAWLNDPAGQPYAALLGEYGMGKTTSCRIFARRLLEARRSGEQAPLPIYLDLRDLKSASRESGKLDTILEALLERANRHDTRNPLTPAELRRLVQDEGALLIIDGLDEALTHLANNDGHRFTLQLLECLPLRVVRNRPAD
ncbi:MAG: NACHT domain-containing protein, partial [Acetobacteraceae bacterium]